MKHTQGDGWHVYGGSEGAIDISIDRVFPNIEALILYIIGSHCIDVSFNRDNLSAHISPDYCPQGAIYFYFTIGNRRQLYRVNIDWTQSRPPWIAQNDLIEMIREYFPDIKIMKKMIDGDGNPFEQEVI